MSRIFLVNELYNIYLKELENKITRDERESIKILLGNEKYILNNYTYLYNIFKNNKYPDENWGEFTRECLVPPEVLYYMYDRVVRLIRNYRQPKESFLEIYSYQHSTRILERYFHLNMLLDLFHELIYSIYPIIQKRLKFEVESIELTSSSLKGKILWPKTIFSSLRQGVFTPLYFIKNIDESHFNTPENFILMYSILKLYNDSLFLKNYLFLEPLRNPEIEILNEINNKCIVILKNTILQDLIPLTKKYLLLDINDLFIIEIIKKFKDRLENNIITNLGYRRLYYWFLKYKNYNVKTNTPKKNNFPITRREHLDAMFELFVLLELLNHLTEIKHAKITAHNIGDDKKKFNRSFSIQYDDLTFDLFYEKWYYKDENSTWSINANPDFSIEVKGELKVIMDAKNWIVERIDEAEYKMLGYLNNLDGKLGILFFPKEKSRISEGLSITKPLVELKHHYDQCLVDCVLPISSDSNSIDNKYIRLEKIINLILTSIKK